LERAEQAAGRIDYLVSYPKSGNTWMRILLANYFSEKDRPHDINDPGVVNRIISSRALFDDLAGIPSTDLTQAEIDALMPSVLATLASNGTERVWLKVHDAQFRLPNGSFRLPPEVSGAAVYIVRNPLDVAVSLAFHSGSSIEYAVQRLCDAEHSMGGAGAVHLRQWLGSWSQHVESWIGQQEIPTLVVRYEDMLQDAAQELERVITFARPEVAIDHAKAKRAVQAAHFDKLRAMEDRSGFRERDARQKAFFRSGRSGDWQEYLSSEQVKRIQDHHGAIMRNFGYL